MVLRSKHLPQIQLYYSGGGMGGLPYPFLEGAQLAELIALRQQKLAVDSFWGYNKAARETYFDHMRCIEECIRIMFSADPDPKIALVAIAEEEARILEELERDREENVKRVLALSQKPRTWGR